MCLQCRRPLFNPCWRRDRLHTPVFLGFPGGPAGKESACNVGDQDLIPSSLVWEDPLEKGTATHFSILAWRTPRREEPGRTWLSDFHFPYWNKILEYYALRICEDFPVVVQWLRIRLPMQGTRVQLLVQEDPIYCRATKPVYHNCWSLCA